MKIVAEHIHRNKEKTQKSIIARFSTLQNQLQEDWKERDAIKAKMGLKRWNNNQHAKRDYSDIRLIKETEYEELKEAIDILELCQLIEMDSNQ